MKKFFALTLLVISTQGYSLTLPKYANEYDHQGRLISVVQPTYSQKNNQQQNNQSEVSQLGAIGAGMIGGAVVGGVTALADHTSKGSLLADIAAFLISTYFVRDARHKMIKDTVGDQYNGTADFAGVATAATVGAVYATCIKKK